ncbi:MAG TPA: arylamine N-acetyltransferase [Melioribacteraceae bacterium]|nr:arylamine N-acetyltransferase [Melioribacteraceae bacterium]
MNIESYLKYLDVEPSEKLTYLYLAKLQMQHMLKIPFENLDIHLNIPIVLNEEYLFNKIINNKRGGFCYELNFLFYNLLKKLGFNVHLLSCSFFHSNINQFALEFDHLALLVILDQSFLVDVGFGDSFRVPIPIPNGQIKDISGKYRVFNNNNEYFLQRLDEENWLTQYKFTLTPRKIEEFAEMCLYHQTSPDTIFTQKKLCTIATPFGRVTLTDDNLTITFNRLKEKQIIVDSKDFNNKLASHFGIVL